jgi:hypothetical protein
MVMPRYFPFIFLLMSCSAIRNTSDKLEESHNALYKQKALLVSAVQNNKVWLTTLTYTRCYSLRGKKYTHKWEPGDTMIIDTNLGDFYDLRFEKECP